MKFYNFHDDNNLNGKVICKKVRELKDGYDDNIEFIRKYNLSKDFLYRNNLQNVAEEAIANENEPVGFILNPTELVELLDYFNYKASKIPITVIVVSGKYQGTIYTRNKVGHPTAFIISVPSVREAERDVINFDGKWWMRWIKTGQLDSEKFHRPFLNPL